MLAYIGRSRVANALAQIVQEIGRLKRTPGLKGDFDRLEKVMVTSLKSTEREYATDPVPPEIQLVFQGHLAPDERNGNHDLRCLVVRAPNETRLHREACRP